MLINDSNITFLYQTYNSAYSQGIETAAPLYKDISTTIPSTAAGNLYSWLGSWPKMREWVGDRVYRNLAAHQYTIQNKDWETTVEVDRNSVNDDQYGIYTPMMTFMGEEVAMHPDELMFQMILNGHNLLCYDGQGFFDTDHPVGSGTASNYDATGAGPMWVLLDASRALKPFVFQQRQAAQFQTFTSMQDWYAFNTKKFVYGADTRDNVGFGLWQMAFASLNTLSEANFEAAYANMAAIKNDTGTPLRIKATHILVGPSNWAAARALFQVATLAGGATNPNFGLLKVVLSPYLP